LLETGNLRLSRGVASEGEWCTDKPETNIRFEAVEPSASLHNAILKIADHQSQNPESRVFRDGNDDYRPLLVESMLAFCEMTRMCGGSDDLLVALAKTGFLEEKFDNTEYFKEIFPAILTERAEILWSLNEKVEAIESLQTLIDNGPNLSYSLVPEEVISANLVKTMFGHSNGATGRMDGRDEIEPFRCHCR